jgi:hypothetical protein
MTIEGVLLFKSIRKYGRILTAGFGLFYNYIRYLKYSAWSENIQAQDVRNYHLVKIYHALEKSMSYKKRNNKRGWSTAQLLLETLIKSHSLCSGEHDQIAVKVLLDFIHLPENLEDSRAKHIQRELENNGLIKKSIDLDSILLHTIWYGPKNLDTF